MPSDVDRGKIGCFRECIVEMRPDQIDFLEHLLRSWRIFGRDDGVALTARAIKRVLNDRP